MSWPENGLFIINGEMAIIISAIRRANKWSHVHEEEEQDTLIKNFHTLKETIYSTKSFTDLEPVCYLSPFLDVIRSENTSGSVTALGLTAVHKFLTYGLIDAKRSNAAIAAENIADAVTHARFMMIDTSSDEVVLLKIIEVLRLLLLIPLGKLLTNESVCEIIQSFFRICFENRFSEILRRNAESALIDTVQLLFCRLPQFTEDSSVKRIKIPKEGITIYPCEKLTRLNNNEIVLDRILQNDNSDIVNNVSIEEKENDLKLLEEVDEDADLCSKNVLHEVYKETHSETEENLPQPEEPVTFPPILPDSPSSIKLPSRKKSRMSYISAEEDSNGVNKVNDFVNPRGIRFTALQTTENGCGSLMPYGLPCVRELFRLLISLISPRDRHNTEITIQIGLSLLTVGLEAGADNLGEFTSLLSLVKDEMCRNLFTLLSSERLSVFTSVMRVFYLLFESLRSHLKFQLEMFLQSLMDIIVSESSKVSYDQRELALDCITQLWHIPGLVTELYINYDSMLYSSNLFEDLTKLLSKNAFPLSGLYSVHVLSLEALLTVIDSIESHCHSRMLSESKFCPEKDITLGALEPEHHAPDTCFLQKASSGYLVGKQLGNKMISKDEGIEIDQIKGTMKNFPNRLGRMQTLSKVPSHEELMTIKHKKKILATGTDQFNIQPNKGITFLQDHGLLTNPLDPEEVAAFLRDNPQLDKKMIGEYISNRKNFKVLEAFVRSFSFEGTRIDEALRQYLETFRLPGEAPLISMLMEHFAEHWHKSNNQPFANNDAAFTLAYAIIILNVDQHNHNVRKQNNPMTLEGFKKNLKDVNGGKDFDDELLEQIYTSIKNEEIVMPAEQTGLVRENYQWKVLLRRGNNPKEGQFIHTPDGLFDHDLFSLVWGPTVAALSFIYDKSTDSNMVQKTIEGFNKCALIAAHYGMCDVFDHLVISLCKFTSLVNTSENLKVLPISFGNNAKAQMATKAVFRLAHGHGDHLREGWKNIIDCILNLFKARLLPQDMVEAEDFVNPIGIISLIREDTPVMSHSESTGLLSSFYSYITSDLPQKAVNQEDEAAKERAAECIKQCHCEQLFSESKFLRIDSLQELVKTLIYACPSPDPSATGLKPNFDEESSVFVTEILIRIILLNRDRVMGIWTGVQDHLFSLVINSAASEKLFLLERTVVGILRIAVRLVRKEEMIPQVMQALQILLLLKMNHLISVSRQVAYALHELLRTNAANIHTKNHWSTIFLILERVGAGAKNTKRKDTQFVNSPLKKQCSVPEGIAAVAQSDSEITVGHHTPDSGYFERGYTSDSELYESTAVNHHQNEKIRARKEFSFLYKSSESVYECSEEYEDKRELGPTANQFDISLCQEFLTHDFAAFLKCCESLAFLVRDAAHITTENFESCIHCIRTFLAASATGGSPTEKKIRQKGGKDKKNKSAHTNAKKKEKYKRSNAKNYKLNEEYDADDDEEKHDLSPAYQHASLQLLDLMHTLHTRASAIFGYEGLEASSADTSDKCKVLWSSCWCPLLQGIAELCCDARRPIRTSALTLLPRALLIPDLQHLAAAEWEACFNKVLFPLLAKLLENISPDDPIGMEETRMRGATLLCKVFLQHLTPLLSLPTFLALWLTILDFMDKYMHADGSGLLAEAIPESLKNMLLVMDTAGIFDKQSDKEPENDHMWNITWDRINAFLPSLKNELFRSSSPSFLASMNSANEEKKKDLESSSETPSEGLPVVADKSAVLPTDKSAVLPAEKSAVLPAEKSAVLTADNDSIVASSVSITIPEDIPTNISSTPPTVILHPPVSPSVYTLASTQPVKTCSNLSTVMSNTVVSPTAVPLLLNPSVMGDTNIQMFNTQL